MHHKNLHLRRQTNITEQLNEISKRHFTKHLHKILIIEIIINKIRYQSKMYKRHYNIQTRTIKTNKTESGFNYDVFLILGLIWMRENGKCKGYLKVFNGEKYYLYHMFFMCLFYMLITLI